MFHLQHGAHDSSPAGSGSLLLTSGSLGCRGLFSGIKPLGQKRRMRMSTKPSRMVWTEEMMGVSSGVVVMNLSACCEPSSTRAPTMAPLLLPKPPTMRAIQAANDTDMPKSCGMASVMYQEYAAPARPQMSAP